VGKTVETSEEDFADRFREIESKRVDAVTRGIASAIVAGAEVVASRAPKDQGDLKRSTHGVVRSPGGYIVVDAPYAAAVEQGSRPHWVSIKALLPWCIRHSSPEEGPGFARALQLKIAREGTKPTYFVRKTLPVQKRILMAEVEHEMKGGD
jgi:hypothetical protein